MKITLVFCIFANKIKFKLKSRMKKIALVGATGLVGSVMIKVLEEKGLNNIAFIPVASEKSIGKLVTFCNKEYPIISVENALEAVPDIAIFSAGGSTSLQYAQQFASKGTIVIDNSSAWRMFDYIPLIVPQINGNTITSRDKIIANPNCSTIQLVMALAPLHKKYKIKRIVVSTYQSVTGTGVKAVEQLEGERSHLPHTKVYPYQIDLNVIPHGGSFEPDGYTSEETKLVHETRKILNDNSIQITATVVRVPVMGGHSESVNVEFYNEFEITEIFDILNNTDGVILQDDPSKNIYPMPLFAEGKNDVFVGRIRRDFSQPNALNLWIVADNLRKGAATNAVEIAQMILNK